MRPPYCRIASDERSLSSRSRAAASARSRCSSLSRLRWPTKWVSIDFGRLTNSSQWMLLSCFNPSSIPAVTWVRKPSYREYTGAQMTLEYLESIRTWRLTTTNTRCLRGSADPGRATRNRSPRRTYSGSPWKANASDCWLSSSAMPSRMAASFASSSALARPARYERAARSRKADRFSLIRSISSSRELGRVTEVLTLIPPLYSPGRNDDSIAVTLQRKP